MTDDKLLIEQWKLASELQKHEDNLSWGKFQYFTAFNSALLAALAFLQDNDLEDSFLFIVIPVLGFALSVSWRFVHERGRAYHKSWIEIAKKSEEQLSENLENKLILYSLTLEKQFPKLGFWEKKPTQEIVSYITIFAIAAWVIIFWLMFRTSEDGQEQRQNSE